MKTEKTKKKKKIKRPQGKKSDKPEEKKAPKPKREVLKNGVVRVTEFYPNGKPKKVSDTYPKGASRERVVTDYYESGKKKKRRTRYRPKRVPGKNVEEETRFVEEEFHDDKDNRLKRKKIIKETTRLYGGWVRGRKKITVIEAEYDYDKKGKRYIKRQTKVTEEYTEFDENGPTAGRRTTRTRTRSGPDEKLKEKEPKIESFDPKSPDQIPSPSTLKNMENNQ